MRARKRKLSEKLGAYVRERYTHAKDAKRELHDTLRRCVRLLDGVGDPDGDGVDLNLNIVAPIVRGVKGLVMDVMASIDDKPYVISATPVPDLPADVEARLAEQIVQRMPEILALISPDKVPDVIAQARNTAMLLMNREATKAARKMEIVVNDDMVEGGWGDAFADWIANFVSFPFAVLKAPSLRTKTVKEWNGQRLTATKQTVRATENISPFDFYWAPNATSIEGAEYLIERRNVGADELIALAMTPTYDVEAVDYILSQHPDGYRETYESGGETPPIVDEVGIDAVTSPDMVLDGTYDTLGFYGKIKGAHLKEWGLDVSDERMWYEAVVWTVGDITYGVSLNPDIADQRPFRVAAWEALPGQIAGRCPTLILEDTQRVCNASVRALARNMALASGVIGEVDASRVSDGDDPRVLFANQIRLTNPVRGQAGVSAYNFHNLPSNAGELMGVFNQFLATGYELLGIPRIAFGSTEGLGTIGRTSGGMSIVMNQASKSVKDALRTIERRIIEPTVQSYVDWNLLYNPDPSIKGDVHAYARGVSGVLEREAQADNLSWALQSIVPLASAPGPDGSPMIPQTAVLRLVYSLFKAKGIPTDGILPDFDDALASQEDLGALGGGGEGGTIEPAGAQALQLPGSEVSLDGRSADAAQAIANSNSL